MKRRSMTALPAVLMTLVSMVLTLAVVVMWLGQSMPWPVALVVGLGIDGGWLATLAYDRRLAAQGDHSTPVTVVGWGFGLVATAVLVAHALTAEDGAGAWLAVAWLPLAAKALWLVHGLWERTALTPDALTEIREIRQDARDRAAVSRAKLRAQAGAEETRLEAVTEAGARVARVQARTADRLAGAWSILEAARQGDGTGRALESTAPETAWALPVWGPSTPVSVALERVDGAPVDCAPELPAGEVYDQEADRRLSTMTPQVTPPSVALSALVCDGVDTTPGRLSAEEARSAIEAAWEEGLTVREAAVRATRSASYVGGIYAQLTRQRGTQPSKGQTRIGDAS